MGIDGGIRADGLKHTTRPYNSDWILKPI